MVASAAASSVVAVRVVEAVERILLVSEPVEV